MILFFIFAAMLVLLCLLWLLFGLFRADTSSTDQEAVNISLARERLAALEAALGNGAIDQSTFDSEKEQLEYDLAGTLKSENEANKLNKRGHFGAATLVVLFVPIAAGALYLKLGDPSAITHSPQAASDASVTGGSATDNSSAAQAPALLDLLPQLEERLATSPDDIDGWRLLGRSYLSVGEFDGARSAFEKAIALDDSDVATLAQLAETIAMTQNGNLAGEPLALLEKATALDRDHEHTLWLMSIARQQAGDHAAALEGFDILTTKAVGNAEVLATIDEMRDVSLSALAANPNATVIEPAQNGADTRPADAEQATEDPAANNASLSVSVSLSEPVLADATPDQAVFIYARASNGPPMPLAVSRLSVRDLPVTVTLDDTMAMIPAMKLSSFASVTVGARVSASGNAIAESGDWYSEQENILVNETDELNIVIDKRTP